MSIVMIIDDNRAKSAYLKMAFTRHGFNVQRVDTYRDAASKAALNLPDLILINHQFETDRGWDIFYALTYAFPHQPILLFTLEHMRTQDTDWIIEAATKAIRDTGLWGLEHTGSHLQIQNASRSQLK